MFEMPTTEQSLDSILPTLLTALAGRYLSRELRGGKEAVQNKILGRDFGGRTTDKLKEKDGELEKLKEKLTKSLRWSDATGTALGALAGMAAPDQMGYAMAGTAGGALAGAHLGSAIGPTLTKTPGLGDTPLRGGKSGAALGGLLGGLGAYNLAPNYAEPFQ